MQSTGQSTFGGTRLYVIIVGVCIVTVIGIASGLEYSAHFAKPGYIPPPVSAPVHGTCYSFEYNCHNVVKHDSSYYASGAYLDQPAP